MSGQRRLVGGVDSSTQSVKVVIRDAATGEVVRQGRAPHPDGTQTHPHEWWNALRQAVSAAGGLADVAAVSVAGQQHGMVCLDADGRVVRPALLWNDTRSAGDAADLVAELGAQVWAEAVGSVPVASFTVTKLRWLARHEPEHAARTAAVCLPHDWLTWHLANGTDPTDPDATFDLSTLVTDRSDASGTGYWSPASGTYRMDLLECAFGRQVLLPRVLGPAESVTGPDGLVVAAGAGDNAGAAFGLGAGPGDVVVSIGTSGTAFGIAVTPAADPTGVVAGFADATGHFLPLVCTLNAAQVLDAGAALLGVDHATLADLALKAPAGAEGLVLVPYLAGERTPNLPLATGSLHGLTVTTMTPAHLARATVEGVLCHLADAVDRLVTPGADVRGISIVGGAAANPAIQQLAPAIFGRPVDVPPPGEYVAAGAARQAAWALTGTAPQWSPTGTVRCEAPPTTHVRERYAEAAQRILSRP